MNDFAILKTYFSTDRGVLDDIKENFGRKITSFGLAPTGGTKSKQLITSDVSLPAYEVTDEFWAI